MDNITDKEKYMVLNTKRYNRQTIINIGKDGKAREFKNKTVEVLFKHHEFIKKDSFNMMEIRYIDNSRTGIGYVGLLLDDDFEMSKENVLSSYKSLLDESFDIDENEKISISFCKFTVSD